MIALMLPLYLWELNYEEIIGCFKASNQRHTSEAQKQKPRSLHLSMTNYDFEFKSLDERIALLEQQVKFLEMERVEIINSMYHLENNLSTKIDKLSTTKYNFDNYTLGDK